MGRLCLSHSAKPTVGGLLASPLPSSILSRCAGWWCSSGLYFVDITKKPVAATTKSYEEQVLGPKGGKTGADYAVHQTTANC